MTADGEAQQIMNEISKAGHHMWKCDGLFGNVSVLQQFNVRDISFPVIVNVLGISDVKRLAHLFMAFTQRFYGAALPMRQNYDLIRRWLNGSV